MATPQSAGSLAQRSLRLIGSFKQVPADLTATRKEAAQQQLPCHSRKNFKTKQQTRSPPSALTKKGVTPTLLTLDACFQAKT